MSILIFVVMVTVITVAGGMQYSLYDDSSLCLFLLILTTGIASSSIGMSRRSSVIAVAAVVSAVFRWRRG